MDTQKYSVQMDHMAHGDQKESTHICTLLSTWMIYVREVRHGKFGKIWN